MVYYGFDLLAVDGMSGFIEIIAPVQSLLYWNHTFYGNGLKNMVYLKNKV